MLEFLLRFVFCFVQCATDNGGFVYVANSTLEADDVASYFECNNCQISATTTAFTGDFVYSAV